MADLEDKYILSEGTPEFYIDSVNVESGLYGSTLLLGNMRHNEPPLVKVAVKVSPPMLKVLSLILSKHVRNYEQELGTIPLPNALLHSLGLEDML